MDFVLAERKAYSVEVARQRIADCYLTNVSLFCDDIRDFPSEGMNLGIGLHCCSRLTDLVMRLCVGVEASMVISLCCYGQIAKPAPTFDGFLSLLSTASSRNEISPNHHSLALFAGPLLASPHLALLSSTADFSVCFDEACSESDLLEVHSQSTALIAEASLAPAPTPAPSPAHDAGGDALRVTQSLLFPSPDPFSASASSPASAQMTALYSDFIIAKRCMGGGGGSLSAGLRRAVGEAGGGGAGASLCCK